ncbi:MAG: substrate-binding periplasmic protein [Dongiaceae bacterium]
MRIHFLPLLFLILLAALLGSWASHMFFEPGAKSAQKQSAYERILQNRVLRCGYVLYPPAVIKDPNTGQFSGIAYEVMEGIGERLKLKIDWVEETSFATNVQGLLTRRYDAVCITYWANPAEGMYVNFSVPFYYSGLSVFARAGDTRFDQNLDLINDPAVKIAVVDGTVPERTARLRWPKASFITLPNITDLAQLFMNVTSGKADIVLAENYQLGAFNEKNNYALKNLTPAGPLRVFPNVIALAPNDLQLKTMVDAALTDMLNAGEIDSILNKYDKYPNSFYRVAKPYH